MRAEGRQFSSSKAGALKTDSLSWPETRKFRGAGYYSHFVFLSFFAQLPGSCIISYFTGSERACQTLVQTPGYRGAWTPYGTVVQPARLTTPAPLSTLNHYQLQDKSTTRVDALSTTKVDVLNTHGVTLSAFSATKPSLEHSTISVYGIHSSS